MTQFENKVAIITGGGTGIGRAVVDGLVAQGGRAFITGRREDPLKETALTHGNSVAYLAADLGQTGTSRQIIDEVMKTFGRIDFVVNNAAAAEVLPLSQSSDEAIDDMLSVNIKAPLALCRDAAAELEKTSGAIVNISSVAGQTAVPGFLVYAATKSAGDRITKILANELGPVGIRVNSVSPGLTQTPMFERTMGPQPEAVEMMKQQIALRRVGEPEEVARSVIWLLSEDASWITGQILQSSGGMMLN